MEKIISWLDTERDSTGARKQRTGVLLGTCMDGSAQRSFLIVGRSDGKVVTISTTDAMWGGER